MRFFKNFKFERRSSSKSNSNSEPCTPVSTISNLLDEIEEDKIDYSPCIQQEAAGIRLEKTHQLIIEEVNETIAQWSTEWKKLTEKHKQLLRKKESHFAPYTTTINLFQKVISALEQYPTQFDQINNELNTILSNLSKNEDHSFKSRFKQQISLLKTAEDSLDVLKKKQEQINNNFKKITEDLKNCRSNTQKYNKLQKQKHALHQEKKKLKEDIKDETHMYEIAQEQYRTNMEKIYQQTQKKEFDRLKSMTKPFQKLVTALKIDSVSLEQAIQKHNPQDDLTAWKQNYFPPSFMETAV